MASRADVRNNAIAVATTFCAAIDTASQGQGNDWHRHFARHVIAHLAYLNVSADSYHRIACGIPRDRRYLGFGKSDDLRPCLKCRADEIDAALRSLLEL